MPPPFRANPKQLELAERWHDPDARVVLIAGAIRTGKTQGAGRLLVETALRHQALYLVARSTYRELEDSTKRAILIGDGNLPPLLPSELRYWGGKDNYRAADNKVVLPNGSEILFRSLEENNIGKILNLTLGGIFVDQIEEIDPGEKGERLFDTLLGRLSHPGGPRKLVAVANPAARMHWVYRRLVDPDTCDRGSRYIHVTMRDNAENLPPGYVEEQEATAENRPAWFRTYVLGEWGAFEGAAYPMFSLDTHVIPQFEIPPSWERFENVDYGMNHPTAWYCSAVDHDGNVITFDEYHEPNLPSATAPIIHRRRPYWHVNPARAVCYADPSMFAAAGVSNQWGAPASVATEFEELGITLTRGNNDRVVGHVRVAEMLTPNPERLFPDFHPRHRRDPGSPRWFVTANCVNLIEQLQAAPIEEDGEPHPGEAVSKRWEGPYGHAHASMRYGLTTRLEATPVPPIAASGPLDDDYRADLLRRHREQSERGNRRVSRSRYVT